MPDVLSSGVRIHFETAGTGPWLVLVHGYTSSAHMQWGLTGWRHYLAPHRRLLLIDLRGHGESEKPHSPAAYSISLMARDVLSAMDAAGVETADILGYSMGGMVAMELLLEHGARFRRAIIGGMGAFFASRRASCRDEESASPPRFHRDWLSDARLLFEYMRHYDRRAMDALADAMFDGRPPVDAGRLREIGQPVLCVAGTRDWLCAGTRLLAERIPDCRRILLDGRTHSTAVRDPRFKAAVARFLWSG